MEFFQDFINSHISTLIGLIIGGIIIVGTYLIYQTKVKHAKILYDLSQAQLDLVEKERDVRKEALDYVVGVTTEISNSIAQRLSNDPSWLDRFMDETGATYSGSVFGHRIRHFHYEKAWLATKALDEIEQMLRQDSEKRICLLVDSGTTTYPIFQEISKRIKISSKRSLWKDRVFVATNSLPGVQYLIKNCRSSHLNPYSDLDINCLLLPGKPLPIYAALTGSATELAIRELDSHLEKVLKWERKSYEIIGFVTGNYFTLETVNGEAKFLPVARGEGHHEIKTQIVNKSNRVFLLAPLLKFSWANVELLNEVNEFHINSDLEPKKALSNPREVRYKAVEVPKEKCWFFTTGRRNNNIFSEFAINLEDKLIDEYGSKRIKILDFDLTNWLPKADSKIDTHVELRHEIPHEIMLEKYVSAKNETTLPYIWSRSWVRGYIAKK